MFLGEFQHTLDYKGRVSVPKKFRELLGREPILTRGLDGCLFLYPAKAWEELSQKLKNLSVTQSDSRAFSRYLFGGATKVSFDGLGRIAIPDYLRNYALLKKEVVLIGVLERIEIWDKQVWIKLEKKLKKTGEAVAERLGSSGI